MSRAPSTAASSIGFTEGSDVPKFLNKWLLQLSAEQKAIDDRERVISQKNIAKLTTRELIKRGLGPHCPVVTAIAKLKEAQQQQGDTPELAEALQALPAQWSTYCILLQEAASGYFRQNAVNTPNFITLYFEQITFLTLWNDVWRRHFNIATGGPELKLLNDIQNEFLSVPDMTKLQQDQAAKAKPRTGSPQEMFNFSEHDMRIITDTAKLAMNKQQEEELQISQGLSDEMQSFCEFFKWLSGVQLMVANVIQITAKDGDAFIVETDETAPTRDIKAALQKFVSALKDLDPKNLLLEETYIKIKSYAQKNIDNAWKSFEEAFEKPGWKDSYRTYILAFTEWSKALAMLNLFDYIRLRNEKASSEGIKSCPDELTSLVPDNINNALVMTLKAKLESARAAFVAEVETLQKHATQGDIGRFMLSVAETLRRSSRLAQNHETIREQINQVAATMDARIESASMQRVGVREEDFRANIQLRLMKADIRANLYAIQSVGNIYATSKEMKDAVQACTEIEATVSNWMREEKQFQQELVNSASLTERAPNKFLSIELMKRPLPATFTRQGKKALEGVYQKITNLDILGTLTTRQLLPNSPGVALDPIETSLMQKYAAEVNQASTFGAILRYALWLMWVLHRDKLNTMHRPMSTDEDDSSFSS